MVKVLAWIICATPLVLLILTILEVKSGQQLFSDDYLTFYARQINAGESAIYARAYAEQQQISSNNSRLSLSSLSDSFLSRYNDKHLDTAAETTARLEQYAHNYAQQIEEGKSAMYARAYARAYYDGIAHPDFYAWQVEEGKSAIYARAYIEPVGSDRQGEDDRAYAEHIAAGISSEDDRAYAEHIAAGIPREYVERIDRRTEKSKSLSSEQSITTAVVLAMYSTTDDVEADKRVGSMLNMTTHIGSSNMDNDTMLGLLNDIAPEASISERKEAADKLASISDASNGELTPEQSMQVANELTRLITGHGIDAEQRAEAAGEIVSLSQSGELNADNASELMATIAPEWSVAERKEALGYLAWQFSEGEWDADSTKRTAEEGYTLITGGEIQMERRMEAGVELSGEVIKRYGGDNLDDESIDKSTTLIKGALSGDLSTDRVAKVLDLDGNSAVRNSTTASYDTRPDYDAIYSAARDSYLKEVKIQESCDLNDRGRAKYGAKPGQAPVRALTVEEINEEVEEHLKECRYYGDVGEVGTGSFDDIGELNERIQDLAEMLASAYAGQIVEDKSHFYAQTYAEKLVSRYDRSEDRLGRVNGYDDDDFEYAHAYAEQIVKGKSERYAREYAGRISRGKSHRYAHAYAEQHDAGESDRYAHAYAEQIDAGKSYTYAYAYAEAYVYINRSYAHDFAVQIAAGKSIRYAYGYAQQLDEGKSEAYAETYAQMLDAGKSMTYAHYYIELTQVGLKSQEYAHAYIEQTDAGESEAYAHSYAQEIENGKSESYSHLYAGRLEASASPTYAREYTEWIEAGKSGIYAHAYATQIATGRSLEYSRAYSAQIAAGRPMLYAHAYAWVADLVN